MLLVWRFQPKERTLVVGKSEGDIQIYDFESLEMLYKIFYDEEVVDLCFTSNNLRFLDIRRHAFNVWELAALVCRSEDEESRGSDGWSEG